MGNANNEGYEEVVVIAVYVPNAEEILFEENRFVLLDKYRKFLEECMEIMQDERSCLDMVMHNNYICGVYSGRCNSTITAVLTVAGKINGLTEELNGSVGRADTEKLIFGVGIAAGIAVRIPVWNPFQRWQTGVWLGSVLNKAYSMAQMAICDGRRRIFAEDMEEYVYCKR